MFKLTQHLISVYDVAYVQRRWPMSSTHIGKCEQAISRRLQLRFDGYSTDKSQSNRQLW